MIDRRRALLGGLGLSVGGWSSASGQIPLSPGVYVEEIPSALRLSIGFLDTATTVLVTPHLIKPRPFLINEAEQVFRYATAEGRESLLSAAQSFFAHGGRELHLFPAKDRSAEGLIGSASSGVGLRGLAETGAMFGGDWMGAQRPLPVGLILVPEASDLAADDADAAAQVYQEAIVAAEHLRAMALIDTPAIMDGVVFGTGDVVAAAQAWRTRFPGNSTHAALYAHQLREKKGDLLPITPAVAGLIAKTDTNRGVWKAPAGLDVQLRQAATPSFTNAQQQTLNVEGINTVQRVPGRGDALWGSRTLGSSTTPEYKYISVRRTMDHLVHSIRWGLQSIVSQPNAEPVWLASRRAVEAMLLNLFRRGAFPAAMPDDAFFVRCGFGETVTQSDIESGRMIIEFGVALQRPTEFVVERIVFEGFATAP